MKPSEEQRLGKKIIAAQERLRQCMCRTGTAAQWHVAKAASVVRKPKLLERVAPHLEGEPAEKYLAALPGWVEQTQQQDAKCSEVWARQGADYSVQRDHLLAMLMRYDFALRTYEKLARQPIKLLVEPDGAASEEPPDESVTRMKAQEFADLERDIEKELEAIDQARAELVAGHEELIVKLTAKLAAPEEAVPYARHGLVKAAENFDVRRGHRFATYAQWWMKTAIKEKKTWDK